MSVIKVNETFSFEKDHYGWKLFTTRPTVARGDREVKNETSTVTTYPGSLEQIAKIIINESVNGCETMEQLLDMLEDAKNGIAKELVDE